MDSSLPLMLSYLRALIFLISLLGIALFVVWSLKHKDQWLYVVAPASWLLHIMAFQLCLFVPSKFGLSVAQLNLWSSAIRLQGVILAVGCALILLFELMIFRKWTISP